MYFYFFLSLHNNDEKILFEAKRRDVETDVKNFDISLFKLTFGTQTYTGLKEVVRALRGSAKDEAEKILKEIKERLSFLEDVGLNYLTLDRGAGTLSGGEAQRIRLASQIGSGLVGVTYVLDEPSIGLHPRDNDRLIQTLQSLKDIGNTVIVVEHDLNTIESADQIIDMGPKAGANGGEVVFSGTLKQILSNKKTLTGKYLSGEKYISLPDYRTVTFDHFTIQGAQGNNLKKYNYY